MTRSPCHPRTSSGLSHMHATSRGKALALGIPQGGAPMHLSLMVGGGVVPCVSGSFAATPSSPSLSIGGGTSSATRGGAAKKNCVTANWRLGFSGYQPGVSDPDSEPQTAVCPDRPQLVAAPHKYNSTRPRCGSPMQCSSEKKEKRMTCLACKAKTHLHLTSPLIQMTKHHNKIDASIGSNHSLYAMCQRKMQTRSRI